MMTCLLEKDILRLVSEVSSWCLPNINPTSLALDLEANPFLDLIVSHGMCAVYSKFGLYLAPATIALTILKHSIKHASQPAYSCSTYCPDGSRTCQHDKQQLNPTSEGNSTEESETRGGQQASSSRA